MTKSNSYLKVFWELLKTDFYVYRQSMVDWVINTIIWASCTIISFAYIFPIAGMTKDFAVFVAVGTVISCIYWDIWSTSYTFIADLEGERTIDYSLTLPLPNYLVLTKYIVSYAIKGGLPALITLPLAKLFLWNSMSFHNFSILKFTIIFLLSAIFMGSFSLFITSRISRMTQIENIGLRFLFPIWFFGGSNYSWKMIEGVAPTMAKINLINPLIYPMEGIRVAVLGQPGYINFFVCVLMTIFFTILFGFMGINKLKNRLDFV